LLVILRCFALISVLSFPINFAEIAY